MPPAMTVDVPFVFVTSSEVEQVVVRAGALLVITETRPEVENHGLIGATVGVSTPFAPPVAVMVGLPAMAL